jgi:shikimate kinase
MNINEYIHPIFLVGYAASGKTTFGKALASAIGREFIDLDFYIEQRFRSTIRDIFAQRGEDGFRVIERNMLREVLGLENVVIACGGGTPCFFNNMEEMNSSGITVMLKATEESLLRRLTINRSRRPLVMNLSDDELLDDIRQKLAQRMPYYSKAHLTFESDNLEDIHQITDSVKRFLALISDYNPQHDD